MRIVVCWGQVAGYMAACWRELARQPGVELCVLAVQPGEISAEAPFDTSITSGLKCRLLVRDQLSDANQIAQMVADVDPDVVYVSGWQFPSYVRLAFDRRLGSARFVMGMDNPLENTLRQRLARLKVGRFIDRMDRVIVPGERAWQFARNLLKVPEEKLRRGLYGIDFDAFASVGASRRRSSEGWPRRFLFAGRYVPTKGIDLLVEAYGIYRDQVEAPWSLTCCGSGPDASLLRGVAGVEDRGFVQPGEYPAIVERCGAFVLASRRDPWPLVICEHCAGGLPIICTEACGSAVELVRPFYNGLSVPSENPQAMAAAMKWIHDNEAMLAEMGRRSQELAAPYSAEMWTLRWVGLCRELLYGQPQRSPNGFVDAHARSGSDYKELSRGH